MPSDLAGLAVWLMAGVGQWQDTGGTTPAVNTNDPVARWDDQSGNNLNFTQPTGGFVPLFDANNVLNGYGCVVPDGTDDRLENASVNLNTNVTVFIVYQTTQVTGQRSPFSATAANAICWHSSSTNFYGWFTGGGHRNTTQAALSGNQIVCWAYDSTNLVGRVYRNGSQIGGDVVVPSQTFNITTRVVGTPSGFMTGRFYEYVIYDRILLTAERDSVFGYLNSKFTVY